MSHLRSMADRLRSASLGVDLSDIALTFLTDLGLSKIVFFDLSRPTFHQILSKAWIAWTEAYAVNDAAGQDPLAMHCLSRSNPVPTGIRHLETHPYLGDAARDMVTQGSEILSIPTGTSITISPDRQAPGAAGT